MWTWGGLRPQSPKEPNPPYSRGYPVGPGGKRCRPSCSRRRSPSCTSRGARALRGRRPYRPPGGRRPRGPVRSDPRCPGARDRELQLGPDHRARGVLVGRPVPVLSTQPDLGESTQTLLSVCATCPTLRSLWCDPVWREQNDKLMVGFGLVTPGGSPLDPVS